MYEGALLAVRSLSFFARVCNLSKREENMCVINRPPTQTLPTVISLISQTMQKIITVWIDKQNNVLGLAFSSVRYTIVSCEAFMDFYIMQTRPILHGCKKVHFQMMF